MRKKYFEKTIKNFRILSQFWKKKRFEIFELIASN